MSKEINHKWERIQLDERDKPDFKEKYICTRGDCKCIKLIGLGGVDVYNRSMQIFSKPPFCYGDTPINKQSVLHDIMNDNAPIKK